MQILCFCTTVIFFFIPVVWILKSRAFYIFKYFQSPVKFKMRISSLFHSHSCTVKILLKWTFCVLNIIYGVKFTYEGNLPYEHECLSNLSWFIVFQRKKLQYLTNIKSIYLKEIWPIFKDEWMGSTATLCGILNKTQDILYGTVKS